MSIAAFITVRLDSTRLPQKALLKVKGIPLLQHLIQRVKTIRGLDKIVICTTNRETDIPLIELAQKCNIDYFCGDEKDIIKRHYMAAKAFKSDFIVNIDGDDIFCDPKYIEKIIEVYEEKRADIIKTSGLPFGANAMGYTFRILEEIFVEKKENETETGWGEYFSKKEKCFSFVIEAEEDLNRPDIRMTLDYSEDFQFFKAVIERLYEENEIFTMRDIINLLDKEKQIIDINRHLHDEYWKNYNAKKVLRSL